MRVFVVLVKGGPEEGPHGAGALDGTEREMQGPYHLFICLVG